jgi:hypothetical protein
VLTMSDEVNQAWVDDEFASIVDDSVDYEANALLDKQIARVQKWIEQHEDRDDPATLHKLIKQVMVEPNKRQHVLVAFCAALWRLKDADT